ncbi:MAG: M20/M25/M40 family metallo-hydrolase, partial [Actinomycetota bacterium]
GRRLDRAAEPTGVVDGIVGLRSLHLEIDGEANHAGTTLPEDRRDALVPLAEAVVEAQRLMRESSSDVLLTVGEAGVVGGATNIVPGRVRATLDVRSMETAAMQSAIDRVVEVLRAAAEANGCSIRVQERKRLEPVRMDERVVSACLGAARARGLDPPTLASMAGHDAMTLAAAGTACGMIFVRSRAGISHSPEESSSRGDCVEGVHLLAGAALELAGSSR